MRAAVGDFDFVMHFGRRCQPPVAFARFTQGVRGQEAFTDAPPLRAVPGASSRVALILFIAFVDHLLVRRAVAAIDQGRATGEGTRTRGAVWHVGHLRARQRPPKFLSSRALGVEISLY